jgi:acyl-CoA synthetase (AMP-forming)/AMP-acid ligase II
MRKGPTLIWVLALIPALGMARGAQAPGIPEAPEDVYRGELVSYPGPWGFEIEHPGIILVRDDELETLASDPDKAIDLSTGGPPLNKSLRQVCELAQARGERTLILAFDHFFKQYRHGQDSPRRLMPDTDEYISKVAAISPFTAATLGLGFNEAAYMAEIVRAGIISVEHGQTEAAPVVMGNPPRGENRHGTVGLPYPDTEVRVVDRTPRGGDLPPADVAGLLSDAYMGAAAR